MRLRHTLKLITWSAAAVVLAVLIIGKDRDYAWIGIVLLAAVFLHFLIETVVLVRRRRFRRRLSDVNEFKQHQQFMVKDLEAALSSDPLLSGASIPVVLSGTVTGEAAKKAPLSMKKALAYRLVAEPLEVMAGVGGQVLLVDSWWGDMTLRDSTGSIRLAGPGVLDGSSLKERVFTMKNLLSELPDIAARVQDGLGIAQGKESSGARISLREIALFPQDEVRVYGKTERTSDGLRVSGNDTLDDPGSLLVKAAVSPASSRLPRRTIQTVVFGAVTACLFAGLCALAGATVIAGMLKPGGLFDATRTGRVRLDLDGRPFRVTIGSSHWNGSRDRRS